MEKKSKDISEVLRAYFEKEPLVLRAYLFGSYARNEQQEDSDIDVLVELLYHNNRFDYFKFFTMQEDLMKLCGKKVDLISEKGVSPLVKPYIDIDKKMIYEQAHQG